MEARQKRLREIEAELAPIQTRLAELALEKSVLTAAEALETWPDGPFTLRWYRYGVADSGEYDEPLAAVRAALSMEDYGEASTQRIEDRNGRTIYDLRGWPWSRVDPAYPEIPGDS